MSISTDTHLGLTLAEAEKRQKQYGLNILANKSQFLFLKELLQSFFSPLILLLLGASLISAFLGDLPDFFIIFGIVIVSGGISFFQHYKAENAVKKLKSKVILNATVIRNGEEKEIPFSHVTIGDVVVLSAGDIVPADIQLIEAKEIAADESSLTGESFPVDKSTNDHEHKTHNMLFAGTHIVSGEGKGLVKSIGIQTQLGKLSQQVSIQKPLTSFDKELSSFSMLVIRLILILAIFVFLVNALFHHNVLSSFLFAIALAVGLTPELMPVIITVSLSEGAMEMDKKDVIVKFLPSIQNLGSMDILCMDKTGTITENNIILKSYQDIDGIQNEFILRYAKLNSFFQSGFKNPLDQCVLAYSQGVSIAAYQKIDEIPFDFDRKKLSVIIKNAQNQYEIVVKGAPQKIVDSLVSYKKGEKIVKLSDKKKKILQKEIDTFASSGLRVIALANKKIERKKEYTKEDEKNLTFLGFLLFIDPVKTTVEETLRGLNKLGIQVKILTGDNAIVTQKACLDAGVKVDGVLSTEDISHLSLFTLAEKAKETTIFANLTPEDKARIISALKQDNHVVGFLGDGVNDAPPLKAADVGISVNNGSDIAKDVADIILMKKSLHVLYDGVIEGRKTFGNTFKYILMSLSSNFGNMISVALASLFLPFLPLLPVQIILIDFLYDLSQITIPSDNVDKNTLTSPKQWSIHFLKRFTYTFGPLSSLFDLLTFSILLLLLHTNIPAFRTGWFIESFVTQTIIIFSIRTFRVPFFRSKPATALVVSALVTILAGLFLALGPFGKYFSFTSLPTVFWIILVGEIILYVSCVELTKLWFYKNHTTSDHS